MGSPYPWHYDLRWPFYHLRPSLRRHVALPRQPLAARFAGAPEDLGVDRELCRVLLFGDLMGLTGDRVPTASPSIQHLFSRADLVIGNCEAPLVREHNNASARYLMNLSLGTAYLRDFFDRFACDPSRSLLSIANNHAADAGDSGLLATEARLASLGVEPLGARAGQPQLLTVREVRGLRLGIAAWTTWMNARFSSPKLGVATAAHAAAFDWRAARRDLQLDTLLATPHWEWEFQHVPHSETLLTARGLAAAGVDAIAGHHPHVLQPLALLPRPTIPAIPAISSAPPPPSVCAFSLGNLFARTLTWPHRLGALLELSLSTTGPRRGQVVAYHLHPTVQLDPGARNGAASVVTLAEAPPALRTKLESRLATLFATRES